MSPRAYLDEALDFMQASAIVRAHIDWAALRTEARTRAAGARTIAETYPSIRAALERLDDRHSYFLDAEAARLFGQGQVVGLGFDVVHPERAVVAVLPGGPAERAGVRVGDIVETIDDAPAAALDGPAFLDRLDDVSVRLRRPRAGDPDPVRLTLSRVGEVIPRAVALAAVPCDRTRQPVRQRFDDIGYLMLPEVFGAPLVGGYATTLNTHLIALASARGWIVDLRRDRGGNMWPMLAGVGPLVGEGIVGAFVDAAELQLPWAYQGGRVTLNGQMQAAGPPHMLAGAPPVAVLLSRHTASAGEAIAVAFCGRPATRTFGEATAGRPTSTQSKVMVDGALVLVKTALDADRTGHRYDAPLEPDESVAPDWALLDTPRDPVLLAALAWLHAQAPHAS